MSSMRPMAEVKVEEYFNGVRVHCGAYLFEHSVPHGGACLAIVPVQSASGNLLRGPLAGAIRVLNSDGTTTYFRESFDTQARLRYEALNGGAAVVAEGVFRNEAGQTVPVGYRRRTEYHASGLIWTTLEVMSDCGCPEVLELSGASITLRRGMTHCAVKLHPSQAGGPDLLGTGAEFPLLPNTTAFLTRFTPRQIQCVDPKGEGIEVFPGAELANWDYACKSDAGLGFYRVAEIPDGTQLDWMPWCLSQRRITTVLQGKLALRLGFALPAPKARVSAVAISANSNSDALRTLAAAGTAVVCCPLHAATPEQLRSLIDAAHGNGLKIVAGVSVHELPVNDPEYARHSSEWMHMAAPSLGVIRTWNGTAPVAGVMCLHSGWLEQLKRHIDAALNALPWDGVCLDGATPYPCCHPAHGRAYHSETEALVQLLAFCRERVGTAGLVLSDAAAPRSLAVEFFTDGAIQ